MALAMTNLAAAWRRFWARESLPAASGPPGPHPARSPGLLTRLLARERLPEPPPTADSHAPSFASRLLAREHLPQPTEPVLDRHDSRE